MTRSEALPQARHLRSARDFRRILEQGRRRRLGHLDVIWMDNQAGQPRIGLIVPKFRSTAVARNRLRRRLREIWRRDLQATALAHDVVIRARRDAYAASFAELRSELTAWHLGVTS